MIAGFRFEVGATDGLARTGILVTPHGEVPTPTFMPVGTAGAVKALTPAEVAASGARMLLGNTYHLLLRPGPAVVARAGGLHRFMAWRGAILTDSGGYQVYSLAQRRKVDDDGVSFRSHIDGESLRLTPESAVDIQEKLGSDIAMALDECPPGDASRTQVEAAMRRTSAWATRCIEARRRADQALFGIVQGGVHVDLRMSHLGELAALPFDGLALGGLSVGEPREAMVDVVSHVAPAMPADRPRYLMGVGTEIDLLDSVAAGLDLFDCVLPTRNARNGQAFTSLGRLTIKQARYREDSEPLDERCDCQACTTFDRRYLRHLFMCNDILAHRMLSLHNLRHFGRLMAGVREAIARGALDAFRRDLLSGIGSGEVD